MKVRANWSLTVNGLKKAGEVFEISKQKYKQLHDKRKEQGKKPAVTKVHQGFDTRSTKPDFPTEYKYEQAGSWFTVYRDGKEVDKFQGAEGLKKYGLYSKHNK